MMKEDLTESKAKADAEAEELLGSRSQTFISYSTSESK